MSKTKQTIYHKDLFSLYFNEVLSRCAANQKLPEKHEWRNLSMLFEGAKFENTLLFISDHSYEIVGGSTHLEVIIDSN